MIIKTIWLQEVDNIETIEFVGSGILNTEVIPLSVTSGAIIRLEDQIIFEFVNLNRPSKVP